MKKQINSFLAMALVALLSACSPSGKYTPANLPQALSNARPGDTLVLANGTYTDVSLRLMGKGAVEAPIVVCAEEAGKVYLEGKSSLQLAGEHVVVSGLCFRNGYSDGPVIDFKCGDEVANNCRVTNCAILSYNPADRSTRNAWVVLYGRDNRFDHNSLVGKLNAEASLIVQLNEERSRENNHSIDHNYFGARPNYGSNGAETIRVGNSTYSLTSSRTRIVDNWFQHCDGEVEHVSIKSCDNVIARNVFYECAGELVLRHGNRNMVENNVFIGNGKPHTGGIRIVNADQVVRNNYMEGLTGKRFYAALAVMNAVPNPLPNRYHQVENVLIEGNTFVRCHHLELGVGADFERTLPPARSVIKNNRFYYPGKNELFEIHTDISGISLENNVKLDVAPDYTYPVARAHCGASWQVEETKASVAKGRLVEVQPRQNALAEALEGACDGDTFILKSGELYLSDRSVLINKAVTIKSDTPGGQRPVVRYNGSKGGVGIITIADGGVPAISGLAFDGAPYEGKARANAGISPAAKMRGTYSAYVRNCEFRHFEESSFAGFKALKNSFADTLSFVGCEFHDISGEGIGLGAEKNDDGKYSAENITISHCRFTKILNAAINVYRGGNDESTTGPAMRMDQCTFTDCSNQERGAALRLIGVQTARLDRLEFRNSGRGGAAIKFDECRWDDLRLSNLRYINSGGLRMNNLPPAR